MLLKVKVAPGHRYQWLSLRMADHTKLWFGKGPRYTVIDTGDLAEGEADVIERYKAEGRVLVRDMPPESPPAHAEPPGGPEG